MKPNDEVIVSPVFAPELCGQVGRVVFIQTGPIEVQMADGHCYWFKPDELAPVEPEAQPTAQEVADHGD